MKIINRKTSNNKNHETDIRKNNLFGFLQIIFQNCHIFDNFKETLIQSTKNLNS